MVWRPNRAEGISTRTALSKASPGLLFRVKVSTGPERSGLASLCLVALLLKNVAGPRHHLSAF